MMKINTPEELSAIDYGILTMGRNLLAEVMNYRMGGIVRLNRQANNPLYETIKACSKTLSLAMELEVEDVIKKEKLDTKGESPQEVLEGMDYFSFGALLGEIMTRTVGKDYMQYLIRNPHSKDSLREVEKQRKRVRLLGTNGPDKEPELAKDLSYGIAAGEILFDHIHIEFAQDEKDKSDKVKFVEAAMEKLYQTYAEEEFKRAFYVNIVKDQLEGILDSYEPNEGSERRAEKAES